MPVYPFQMGDSQSRTTTTQFKTGEGYGNSEIIKKWNRSEVRALVL